MNQDPSGWRTRAPLSIPGESPGDYRERAAQRQAELETRRRRELVEQCSTHIPAADRIRIWERLHQVALPRDPGHRLVEVIAAQTALTTDDIHQEQLARWPAPPAPGSAVPT